MMKKLLKIFLRVIAVAMFLPTLVAIPFGVVALLFMGPGVALMEWLNTWEDELEIMETRVAIKPKRRRRLRVYKPAQRV